MKKELDKFISRDWEVLDNIQVHWGENPGQRQGQLSHQIMHEHQARRDIQVQGEVY